MADDPGVDAGSNATPLAQVRRDGDKRQLHELVESVAPEHVPAALQYLNFLSADPMLAAIPNAPPYDEPYTDEQRRKDALAEAAIRHGDGISHEEVLREFGA